MSKKLAIIVPYRDREEHLEKFILAIESHLDKTDIDYQIWIIEQGNNMLFNKGALLNVGFDLTSEAFDYFCFHDVDLLPENEECQYQYPESIAHLSTYVQQYRYKPQQPLVFLGGVVLFTGDAFQKINGYSNGYMHWGAEDSDIYWRTQQVGVPVIQRPGRYLSLFHTKRHGYWDAAGNPTSDSWGTQNMRRLAQIKSLYKSGEDVISADGLSSVEYIVLGKKNVGRHVRIAVDFYDGEVEQFIYKKLWRTTPLVPFHLKGEKPPPPFMAHRRTVARNTVQQDRKRFNRRRLKLDD